MNCLTLEYLIDIYRNKPEIFEKISGHIIPDTDIHFGKSGQRINCINFMKNISFCDTVYSVNTTECLIFDDETNSLKITVKTKKTIDYMEFRKETLAKLKSTDTESKEQVVTVYKERVHNEYTQEYIIIKALMNMKRILEHFDKEHFYKYATSPVKM